MSNLNVVAIIEAKPDGVEAVRSALSTLVVATRAEEGCVSYELSESLASPGTFVVVEVWRSQADLAEHAESAHMKAAFAAVGELLASAPAIHPLRPVDVSG
ncbi:antibiotic biosynthesis monooxygenase [Antrihabitans sp. YC3-6]|uniref:Antibiotic biosynthesis monooxygenase n=1 Tax=Antrihabitans stalagmiti TaxID=2799499 RepID=A0A934NTR1_9NOCA|nr:putative quinol monooxygenase [Antrihabitans stalagmiti]MBJ8341140.1 antibiotic biosynthesis monooxygenase [Antrihabitans stalagmiti]